MRVMKKYLSLLLAVAMVLSMMTVGASAEETVANISDVDSAEYYAYTDWYNDDDTSFVLTTNSELAGLAKLVNEGNNFKNKTVTLGADIDLGDREWTPIGNESNYFSGTFDGDGYTVSNLKVTGSNNKVGLFGYVKDAGGTRPSIKDLTVTNVDVSGYNYTGAIVGHSYLADISNCHVNGTVKLYGARSYVGGIVGYLGYGAATNCSVLATGTGTLGNDAAIGGYVGGIAGQVAEGTSNVISGCTVENLLLKGDCIGGISGIAHYDSAIKNNTLRNITVTVASNGSTGYNGLVTGDNRGKSGQLSYVINNTLVNTSGTDADGSALPIAGMGPSGGNTVVGTGVEFDENDKITAGTFEAAIPDGLVAEGYTVAGEGPWVVGKNYTATFNVTPADATVVVKQGETVVDPVALHSGYAYTYTVSADGYVTESGTIAAGVEGDQAITVELELAPPATYTATFAVTPSNATVVVKQGETVVEPVDGVYTLRTDSAYTYTISADGYVPVTDTIAAGTEEDQAITVELELVPPATYTATFAVTPANATVVVKQGETVVELEDGVYILRTDSAYTYTVSASGYVTKSGTIAAGTEENQTITVALVRRSYSDSSDNSSSSSSSGTSSGNPTVESNTATGADGSVTVTEVKKDGTTVETTTAVNGSTGVTTQSADGTVSTKVTITASAVETATQAQEPVVLPMAPVEAATDSAEAPVITVALPAAAESVRVEVPVEQVTSGTVAVIVNADGTETIVPTTAITDDGIALMLEEGAVLKIVDNSKDFIDVPEDSTFADNINFVAARGLFTGTTAETFSPASATTRGQVMTVLARTAGADTSGTPIEKGMEWAKEYGISDGTNASGAISRQQLATMLWRFAGAPVMDTVLVGSDSHLVQDYARMAMAWCMETGIMNGYPDGSLRPGNIATRGHVAAMTARLVQWLA